MRRRVFLGGLGVMLSGGLAGCSGGGGDETDTTTETATPTATATATSTPTPTATPTAAATPTAPTHELNETFTVGEGSNAVTYTFKQFFRAQELGPTRSEQADGTFLIVILTVANPQSKVIDVPTPNIKLRASGVIRNIDTEASQAVASDSRIDIDSIAGATISPKESVTGAIVYDAPTGNTYRIAITPPNSSDGTTHYVPVGNIADIERLSGGY